MEVNQALTLETTQPLAELRNYAVHQARKLPSALELHNWSFHVVCMGSFTIKEKNEKLKGKKKTSKK